MILICIAVRRLIEEKEVGFCVNVQSEERGRSILYGWREAAEVIVRMVCVAARASSSAGVRWVGSPRWFCVSDAIPPSVQTGATTGHPGDGFAREAQRLSHHQQW
ncbi:uncharacterized protein TNCT_637191 [Trichonephila clavata]|uniref:Uncharacterized protein n=1 Tax=Trichonephila clavata TaxID=2740835 RepID=A0A8X6HAI5_TRICU|nr:uncharacterized protein TNCT_637191 [Trichonephila clavata]